MTRLLHVFSTFQPGGPQVRTTRLVAALGPEFEHAFVALDGRTEARGLLPPDARTEVLPGPRRGPGPVLAWTRRALRERRPDLVLTYNWGAIEVVLGALLLRAPVLHHEDGFLPEESRGLLRRRTWARRALLPRVRGVVVPSHRLQEIALGVWRLAPALVHLVPNGVRLADFAPRAEKDSVVRRELGIAPGDVVLGSVGHLRPEKNPVRLVEAFALAGIAERAHLLVLGDGPERAGVEAAARARGVAGRVHLVGHRADPRPCYAAMDVFCLSSDTEQMPVALLEAMASELPVCATDVGDVLRMLPAEQGAWVARGQGDEATRELARVLGLAVGDGATRAALGRANRARVAERYGFETMAGRYRELYASCARVR